MSPEAAAHDLPPLMDFAALRDAGQKRRRAAQLLQAVLEERIEPRLAINRWPEAGETPDLSLDCAYQALWHFEADEQQQQGEIFYMDAQLELLRQIARCLAQEQALPPYILKMYSRRYTVHFFYAFPFWEGAMHFVTRCAREAGRIVREIVCFTRQEVGVEQPAKKASPSLKRL